MDKDINWTLFLQPYEFAVSNFLIKLQFIKKQYISQGLKNPIEDITGRVKNPKSIMAKLDRMKMSLEDVRDLTDIAGIRITCKYIQEVYEIYEMLSLRKDIKIVLVKDYIKNPKPSGYRSLHIIAKYNAETLDGQMGVYMEFQIRTLAMHLWASIEHSLKYKYYMNIPTNLRERLIKASKIAYDLDKEMSKIKNDMELINNINSLNESQDEWLQIDDFNK